MPSPSPTRTTAGQSARTARSWPPRTAEQPGCAGRSRLTPGPEPVGAAIQAWGLSRFWRNEKTQPPLTLAVTGEWGTGKSSLMNLLRSDLKRYGFRPVWFNAWHQQKAEHLLAPLLEGVC